MKQQDTMNTSTHGTLGPNKTFDAPDGVGLDALGQGGDGWVEDYNVATGDSGNGMKFIERSVPGLGFSGMPVAQDGDGKGEGK